MKIEMTFVYSAMTNTKWCIANFYHGWMRGNSKDPSKGCIICDNPYHTTDCKWIQIVNLTRSLTPSYQKELERVCPYLKQYIERIEKKFYYTAMWKFWEEQV